MRALRGWMGLLSATLLLVGCGDEADESGSGGAGAAGTGGGLVDGPRAELSANPADWGDVECVEGGFRALIPELTVQNVGTEPLTWSLNRSGLLPFEPDASSGEVAPGETGYLVGQAYLYLALPNTPDAFTVGEPVERSFVLTTNDAQQPEIDITLRVTPQGSCGPSQ